VWFLNILVALDEFATLLLRLPLWPLKKLFRKNNFFWSRFSFRIAGFWIIIRIIRNTTHAPSFFGIIGMLFWVLVVLGMTGMAVVFAFITEWLHGQAQDSSETATVMPMPGPGFRALRLVWFGMALITLVSPLTFAVAGLYFMTCFEEPKRGLFKRAKNWTKGKIEKARERARNIPRPTPQPRLRPQGI